MHDARMVHQHAEHSGNGLAVSLPSLTTITCARHKQLVLVIFMIHASRLTLWPNDKSYPLLTLPPPLSPAFMLHVKMCACTSYSVIEFSVIYLSHYFIIIRGARQIRSIACFSGKPQCGVNTGLPHLGCRCSPT